MASPELVINGSGDSSGSGYGDGHGYGDSYGYGYGSGYGYGCGSGYGSGYGYGDGYGDLSMKRIGEVLGYQVRRADTPFGPVVAVGCEAATQEWWRANWRKAAEMHGDNPSKEDVAHLMALMGED